MKQRQIVSAVLASALIFTGAATLLPGTQVTALAAKKKAKARTMYVTDTAKSSDGTTIKFTYNKKGQLKKQVSTRFSNDTDKDSKTTATTTFGYDKKGYKISETTITAVETTSYNMSKNDPNRRGSSQGTVTTATTEKRKYSNNKKGLLTKAVSDSTTILTGKTVKVTEQRLVENSTLNEVKNADGSISYIAGYNNKDLMGNDIHNHKSQNAYYYKNAGDDDINQAKQTVTTTTTYTDNGDGTYTETVNTLITKPNYTTTEEYSYYVYPTDENGNRIYNVKAVPVTKTADGTYTDASGKTYNNCDFSRIKDVIIKIDPDTEKTATTENTDTNVYTNNSTSTTVYTIKKGHATKSETTSGYTFNKSKSTKRIYSNPAASENQSVSSEYLTSSSQEQTSTSKQTTVYTYNKKGQLIKTVTSDDGIRNEKTIEKNNGYTRKDITNLGNGITGTNQSTSTGSDITTTTIADGKKTVSTPKTPSNYTNSYITSDGKQKSNDSATTTYYGNGGYKTSYSSDYVNSSGSGSNGNEKYYLDESGDTYVELSKGTYTPAEPTRYFSGNTWEYNNYYDGKHLYSDYNEPDKTYSFADDPSAFRTGSEVATAAASAISTLEASGERTDITTTDANALPSKTTTTYTYDKKGNQKAVKTESTSTSENNLRNETFGNPIYTTDADGNLIEIPQTYTSKSTRTSTTEATMKKGRMIKQITMTTHSYNDRSSSGYDVVRTTYKYRTIKVR